MIRALNARTRLVLTHKVIKLGAFVVLFLVVGLSVSGVEGYGEPMDVNADETPAGSVNQLAVARIWRVDDDGVQAPDADFDTIQPAVNAAADGDTVLVFAGDYPGAITVTKRLTITGDSWPLIDSIDLGSGFTLLADGITIEGFDFVNAGVRDFYGEPLPTDYPAEIEVWSDHNILRGNQMEDGGRAFYVGNTAARNTITHNEIMTGYLEIEAGDNNFITHNNFSRGSGPFHFITVNGLNDSDLATGNRIENNSFSDIDGLSVLNNYHTEGTVIAGNDFQDCLSGIRVGGDNHQIINNILYGPMILTLPGNSVGIDIYNADNTLLDGNVVERFGLGVSINSVDYGIAHTNTIMRNNHLANNEYNFAPIFPPGMDYPYPEAFDLDIDTSNTVEGRTVYYLHDVSDTTFNPSTVPDAGFLACINCNNITVTHLTLDTNAHGILLYNVTDALIDDVYVFDNFQAGISLYDCQNVTIQNTQATHNGCGSGSAGGYGISLDRSTDCVIEGCTLETNCEGGISFLYSDNNTLRNSQVLDNGSDAIHGIGVRLFSSDDNIVHSNRIASTVPGEQYDGMHIDVYSHNIIYNNIFQNARTNAYASSDHNTWNISKTLGVNIVGGPYLGGNYWHDYTGVDTDGDLIGDTDIPYTADGDIESGGDYLPLIPVTLTPLTPTLIISSPIAMDYVSRSLPLRYEFDGQLTNVTYVLDSAVPVRVDGPTSIERLTLGEHTVELAGQDREGHEYTAVVTFTIIPLGLAAETVGTPEYPDEAAFSFIGRAVSHTLTFQARNPLGSDLQVHLNRHLDGVMGYDPEIVDYYESGVHLGSIGASDDWVTHTFAISVSDLSVGWANLVSFINLTNAESGGTPLAWGVRNLTLRPDMPIGMPRIHVESDRAFSPGAQMSIWLEIDDVADDGYQAYVYLVGPDGTRFYYPDWGEERTPLDDAYVQNNHYGRLPKTFDFSAESVPGTYQLVAELTERGPDGRVMWLANQSLFFSEQNTVKLYLNREIAADGDRLVIESAIAAPDRANGRLVISLETPVGQRAYLPIATDLATVMATPPTVTYNDTAQVNPTDTTTDNPVPFEVIAADLVTPSLYLPIVLRNGIPEPTECDYPLSGLAIDGPGDGAIEALHYFSADVSPAEATPPLSYIWTPEPFIGQGTAQAGYEWQTPGVYTLTLSARNCGGAVNATHVITVEAPTITWSTPVESLDYAPLVDDYVTLFDERVDARWESGTYTVRGTLYNDVGDPVAYDFVTFDICRDQSGVTGTYYLSSTFDISPTAVTMDQCQLTLIDATTLEYLGERVIEGPHSTYAVTATPGAYVLSGMCYDEAGSRYLFPTSYVDIGCGAVTQRDVKVVHLSDPPATPRAAPAAPLRAQGASDEECSKPKAIVFIHIDQEALDYYEWHDGTERSQEQIMAELNADVFDTLRSRSPGLDLLSGHAIWQAVYTLKQLKEQGKDIRQDVSHLAQAVKNVEYVYWMQIGLTFIDEEDDTGYIVFSSVTDIDSNRILRTVWQDRKGTNFQETIDLILYAQGNIAAGIENFERTRITAPRDPKVSITKPPKPVSPEEPETEFWIRAVDCRGDPAYNETWKREYLLSFPHLTERGEVTAKEPSGVEASVRDGMIWVNTNPEGYAGAQYRLTAGDYGDPDYEYSAGKDPVEVYYPKQGKKVEHITVQVPLIGTRLDIVPRKKEIGVEQETILDISLVNLDENGNETPVAGKPVRIQYDACILRGGRITVLGEKDAAGNPLTDQDGKAQIKFKAGKEDGLVAIEVLYQPPGFVKYIDDIAEIQVKKDEFVVRIRWQECLEYYRRYHMYSISGDMGEAEWGYCYQFNVKSIWDRTSKRKTTSADLHYTDQGHGAHHYQLEDCSYYVTAVSSTDISSSAERQRANKYAFLIEHYDYLFMPIAPLQITMTLKGESFTDWTEDRYCRYGNETETGTDVVNYDDLVYYPQPMKMASCVLRTNPFASCSYWPDDEFAGFAPELQEMLMLEKLGESTYSSYHYDYDSDLSGVIFLGSYPDIPFWIGTGYRFNEDNRFVLEHLVLGPYFEWIWEEYYGDWEYYPSYFLDRSFSVTVVKK